MRPSWLMPFCVGDDGERVSAAKILSDCTYSYVQFYVTMDMTSFRGDVT